MMENASRTVLIVEDSPVQASAIGTLLVQNGVRVLFAPNGQEGVSMARRHLPDAIVLDLEMPMMNGFEVCQCLKGDACTAEIPIVMLTQHDSLDKVIEGVSLGAIDFIPKDGFAETVLVETLRQLHVLGNGSAAEE